MVTEYGDIKLVLTRNPLCLLTFTTLVCIIQGYCRRRVINSLSQLWAIWATIWSTRLDMPIGAIMVCILCEQLNTFWFDLRPTAQEETRVYIVNLAKKPRLGNSWVPGVNLLLLICYIKVPSYFPLNHYLYHRLVPSSSEMLGTVLVNTETYNWAKSSE